MDETNTRDLQVETKLVNAKLVDYLLHHSLLALIASQGIAVLVYWALHEHASAVFVHSWITVFTAINIVRLLHIILSRRSFSSDNAERIARQYSLGALSGGLIWASLIFAYQPGQPFFVQLFLLITLVGMPIASLASNAIRLPIYFAFSTPILVALIGWGAIASPALRLEFTLMAAVYAVLVIMIARQYSNNLRNSIEREEENRLLIGEVRAVNAQLLQMAYLDPLTNLSNRRQFEERARGLLEKLTATASSLALMLVDIDNFKTINDTLGHEAGDNLLKEVSGRLTISSRKSELVIQTQVEAARIGGDEFVVMYHLTSDGSEIEKLAERMLEVITESMTLGGESFSPSVSIGIALAPKHATVVEDLLRVADAAMYRAKKKGGCQFVVADVFDGADSTQVQSV